MSFPNTINLFKGTALLAIVVCSLVISQSSLIVTSPYVATAITVDLLLTLPLLYLVFIRRTAISKLTVLPLVGAAAFVAWLILPANDRTLLELALRYGVPVLELAGLLYAAAILVKARRRFKAEADTGHDVMERLRNVLETELSPRFFASALAFEIGAVYFAFFRWRKRSSDLSFSYHKRPGVVAIISVFIFVLIAETTVVHILLTEWNPVVAWVLTALSAYFVLQLFAHAKAVVLRPIEIFNDHIMLRCGLLGDATINVAGIVNIETTTAVDKGSTGVMVLSPIGKLAQPNVKITLSESTVMNRFYGLRKPFSAICIGVDEPEVFLAAVRDKMEEGGSRAKKIAI